MPGAPRKPIANQQAIGVNMVTVGWCERSRARDTSCRQRAGGGGVGPLPACGFSCARARERAQARGAAAGNMWMTRARARARAWVRVRARARWQALGIEAAAETEEVGLFLELPRLALQHPPAKERGQGLAGPDSDG